MGWFFMPGMTRSELITERTKGWSNDKLDAVCLKHALRGNVLWTIWEHHYKDGRSPVRFIGCDLLQYSRYDLGWGYKAMDESEGPCYYTCPLSFLDLAPPLNENWRAAVRAYHARIRRPDLTLRVGMIVKLWCTYPPEVQIVSIKPLRGQFNGTIYRLKRREIKSVIGEPAADAAA
jgi:hypothetical protein